jgi:hypothetical protein
MQDEETDRKLADLYRHISRNYAHPDNTYMYIYRLLVAIVNEMRSR